MQIKLADLSHSFGLLKLSLDLMNVNHDSVFADAVRTGAKENLKETIRMVCMQADDNFSLVADIIGYDLLTRVIAAKC